MVVSCIS